jgi:RNA polymerase sigma factor (sigma-70 family)
MTSYSSLGSDAAERETFASIASGGQAAEHAIGRLYTEYAPRFRAFLRTRGVAPEPTEDLIQDVFVRLLESPSLLAAVESPRAYLWCTLRNALTDHARRTGRERRRFVDPPAGDADAEDSSFESWLERTGTAEGSEPERIDHVECIGRALDRFRRQDPDRAIAIDLVAIEGFEGRELALALGKSYGAAREFLSQARKALRSLVEALCGSLYA